MMRKIAVVVITARHNFNDLEEEVNKKILELHTNGMKVVSVAPFFKSSSSPVMMIYNIIYETPEKEEKINGHREVAIVKVTQKNDFKDIEELVNGRIEDLYKEGKRVVSICPFFKHTSPVTMIYNIICEVPEGKNGTV